MDLDRVRELMALLQESDLTELEVQDGDSRIRLVRPAPGAGDSGTFRDAAASPQTGPAQRAASGAASAAGAALRAPMAGTFYAAPEPGAEPFLAVGAPVQAGDVVCIIESMKMMNEIRAEHSGVCQATVARNGEPVRAGDTLFVIG